MIEIQVKKRLQAAQGPMLLNVDLQLPGRQLVGLYGKSGAGKTSLLRILAGLFAPDEARITIDGHCWIDTSKGINLSPQQRSVGMVFQDYALFPNMTVKENLRFALKKDQPPGIVAELIELMELGDLQHQYPARLSGGQQQRVALARALVQQPRLLLLDEPLSALDQELRSRLQQHLLQVHRTYEMTILLISHDPDELQLMADWVIMLDEGQLVRQGDPVTVFPLTQQTITLKGKLTKTEVAPNGYWLTIENGPNVWRIHSAKLEGYTIGEEVAVNVKAKA
jgi:molybdate transport system ATP-binding protein